MHLRHTMINERLYVLCQLETCVLSLPSYTLKCVCVCVCVVIVTSYTVYTPSSTVVHEATFAQEYNVFELQT